MVVTTAKSSHPPLTYAMTAVMVWVMATQGRDLRIERAIADISVKRLGEQMGLSRQALWALERRAEVSEERAAQYRRALRDIIETSERVA